MKDNGLQFVLCVLQTMFKPSPPNKYIACPLRFKTYTMYKQPEFSLHYCPKLWTVESHGQINGVSKWNVNLPSCYSMPGFCLFYDLNMHITCMLANSDELEFMNTNETIIDMNRLNVKKKDKVFCYIWYLFICLLHGAY